MWEAKKAGQVYAYGPGSRGCSPETLRDMMAAGYMLYIDGKKQKKPPLEAQTPRTAEQIGLF